MLFSGKITNSVITYLQRREDAPDFYDLTDLPLEFLKDPSCWLEAARLNTFLAQVENWCVNKGVENPLEVIGHSAKDLKAWGVLDSVLRMIERPDEIFLQPHRFISYFVSPAPPIANIRRGESTVAFDLPISFEEFPHVATYIRSAMEAVPDFMGLPMAEVRWQQNHLTMGWSQSQAAFEDTMNRRQMAPEVVENLISTLEKTEQALLEKTRELDRIKHENTMAARSQVVPLADLTASQNRIASFHQQVMKLQDYFTRSQQLITLLVGQDRLSPQVREAMRRVNWEHVQTAFPEITRELLSLSDQNNQTTDRLTSEPFHGQNHSSHSARDSRQSWLPNS